MNKYNISVQIALPIGNRDSADWFIQFRGVGSVLSWSAEDALRFAKKLGWRAPAVSCVTAEDPELPLLTEAPRNAARARRMTKDAPALPVRYLRIPRGEWK